MVLSRPGASPFRGILLGGGGRAGRQEKGRNVSNRQTTPARCRRGVLYPVKGGPILPANTRLNPVIGKESFLGAALDGNPVENHVRPRPENPSYYRLRGTTTNITMSPPYPQAMQSTGSKGLPPLTLQECTLFSSVRQVEQQELQRGNNPIASNQEHPLKPCPSKRPCMPAMHQNMFRGVPSPLALLA